MNIIDTVLQDRVEMKLIVDFKEGTIELLAPSIKDFKTFKY